MTLEEQVSKQQLFKEIQFSLCEDVIQFENVKRLLLSGGAKFFNYLSDNVTHLIGDNCEHHSVSEAVEIYEKPVVTSRWVWLSAKASELLPTAGFSPFKNQLFSNITACPSNISGPDVQSLWAMITYYGGAFRLQLESDCTHLISTKPDGAKYEKAVQTNDRIKIVTPDWVIDSVKNKSLCDEDLYHPRLLIFNYQSNPVKLEMASEVSIPSVSVSAGSVVSNTIPSVTTSGTPQLALRTVSLPTTAMITTFSIAQPPQASPTTVQGGRVRVFLPPQHQVRLMQMKQNQIRQLCPPVGAQQQVVNVQQMLQRQALQQNFTQTQQTDNQSDANQQWNQNQQFITQNPHTGPQSSVTSQPIQVISQSAPEFAKLRPINTTVMSQQQPRQVYLAVQQTRQQHFIQVPQQSQLQQQRQQSNIIIQQRGPTHGNVQQVRLQQAPQHLIQLQQRQPISLQSVQSANYVRAPQQIIIQQQNQQAIQRQIQLQQQALQNNQNLQSQQQSQSGAIGHPQVVQQRMAGMTAQRMPQQFIQQNQMRGQQIRGPIGAQQQIISSAIPSGQPRVFMKAQTQYSIQGQQQFEAQQQTQQGQQFIRGQTSGAQLQFIRGPQWAGSGQEGSGVQGQHLTPMRPQHILVTTQPTQSQPQPTQQQIIQWQQQDIQRRQMMQQQQNQQRFQVSAGAALEKVRPTVSVVSVSSSANTDSGASAASSGSTVRIAAQTQPTISPNIALSGPQSNQTIANAVSAQVSPVSTANTGITTPNTTVASPVVNPKTKTALANLLNNRLQSGNTGLTKGDGGNSSTDGFPSNVSVSGSLSLSSSSTSLPNKTGFIGSPGVALPTGEVIQHLRQDDSHLNQNQMQFRFFGFDPRLQIPPDLCLMGCVFHITGYQNIVESKLIEIWEKNIKKFGAEVEKTYSSKCTHILCDNFQNPLIQQCLREGKRCLSVLWLNDILSVKKMLPPSKIYHLPYVSDDSKPCKNHIITITNFEGEERVRVKDMILRTGAKYTNYLTQKNTIIVCKRLEGEKYRKSVEWRLAIVNVVWLHDILFGQFDALQLSSIAKKYQNFDLKDPFKIDYQTVQHLMNPWRQPIRLSDDFVKTRIEDKKNKQSKQNSIEEMEDKNSMISEERTEEPLNKKPKLQNDKSPVIVKEESVANISLSTNVLPTLQSAPNPEIVKNIKVMFTSIDNNNRQELRSIVLSLGGKLTNVCNECTHLVTDRIARTVKFLCSFSSCKFIVTSKWITDSEKQNEFLDENEYIVSDESSEEKFGFNLKHSLKIKNNQLFKNFVFYITNGCIPSPKLLKEIIESVGGQAVLSKRPTRKQLEKMFENGLKFYVISCENDLHLCDVFFNRKVDVLNVEFVLSGILKQELDFDLYAFKQNILKDN